MSECRYSVEMANRYGYPWPCKPEDMIGAPTPPPPDMLVDTYKGIQIYRRASDGQLYVKGISGTFGDLGFLHNLIDVDPVSFGLQPTSKQYRPPVCTGTDELSWSENNDYAVCVPASGHFTPAQQAAIDAAAKAAADAAAKAAAVSSCSKGNQYTFGISSINDLLGICEPGYTKGFSNTCNCDSGATPITKSTDPLASIGKVMDMLPMLLLGMVLIAVLGMFKK